MANWLSSLPLPAQWRDHDVEDRVNRLELPFNHYGIDPFGVEKEELIRFFSVLAWMYKRYFKVHAHGVEHVPKRGRGMIVGNHSGGVALDGAMILCSLLLELEPPRLAHGMAEKFLSMLPFASMWSARTGQLCGLPEHAERLLGDERLLMVFPEGARGTAKLYWERNSLVHFGNGFVRLAMATKSPIIPAAFIGGGSAIPTIANLYKIGKLFGAPYIPVTPWIFPIPRPVPLDVYYGEPILLEGSPNEEDAVIEAHVERVKSALKSLIDQHKDDVRA